MLSKYDQTTQIYLEHSFLILKGPVSFFQFGFTPCKAEQALQGMQLQEKKAQKV